MFWKYLKEYKWQMFKWVWQYIKYLHRHITYVREGCWNEGLFFAGLFHDWSKWLPDEFIPYMLYFYGPKFPTGAIIMGPDGDYPEMKAPEEIREAFDHAWNQHQKRHPHHWQYWLLSPDIPRPTFHIGSYGDPFVYGVELYEKYLGKTVFYKPPEDVWKENAPEDVERENRLKDALDNTPVPLKMPLRYAKEMLADWRGAGRALGKPDTAAWYKSNRHRIFLHPETRAWVEDQLGIDGKQ